MPKLILAMACKNEAETIAKAIKSVATVAHAAVISIDSLDEQDTRAAAERACAECNLPVTFMTHVWANHFSNMRNGVMREIERLYPDADWGIWIDGHEYLAPGHQHRLMTLMMRKDLGDLWLCSYTLKMLDNDGVARDSFLQAKMWRIGHGILYGPRAQHNQFDDELCPETRRGAFPEIFIMHDRPIENARARAKQRNQLLPELLLPKAYEGDEDAVFHMLAHFYQVDDRDEYFKTLKLFNPAATQITSDCQYQIHLYTACMYARMAESARDAADKQREDEMWAASFGHLAQCDSLSSVRNDHICQRARNWFTIGDYERAFHGFEAASRYVMPVTQSFAQEADYTWQPLASMALCREKVGAFSDAWALYLMATRKGGPVGANILNVERVASAGREGEWPDDGLPRLLVLDKLNQFSADLALALTPWYSVRVAQQVEPWMVGLADIIWCEWIDENLINVSALPRAGKVIYGRLHGYEAIERDYPRHVNWRNVDGLVGVSDQMLAWTRERFGDLPVEMTKIPNALDCGRYRFRDRSKREGRANIAVVSLLNNKKNIAMMVEAARALRGDGHHIHVAGKWQDVRLEEYFRHAVHEEGVDNIHYAGWVSDVDGFLEDKDFLLNTSLWESFSFAIHEAMAKGIKPLVHRWVSVGEFIPRDLQWGTMDELRSLIAGPYESLRYRAMALDYDLPAVARQTHEYIETLRERARQKAEAA